MSTLDLRKELDEARAFHGPDHPHTLEVMGRLGDAYLDEDFYVEAVPIFQRLLVDASPDGDEAAVIRIKLGRALVMAGRYAESVPVHEWVVDYFQDRPELVGPLVYLGLSYNGVGRHAEAAALFEQVIEVQEAERGTEDQLAVNSHFQLISAYQGMGRQAEGLTEMEIVLSRRIRMLGPGAPPTQEIRLELANSYRGSGRDAEALPLLEEAAQFGDDMAIRRGIAACRLALGQAEAAVELIRETISAQRGRDEDAVLELLPDLVDALESLGDEEGAIEALRELVRRRETQLGMDAVPTVTARFWLANNLREADRHDEAVELHARVVADWERVLGEESRTWSARHALGISLRLAGRLDEAVRVLAGVAADRALELGDDSAYTVASYRQLAYALTELGEFEPAIDAYEAVASALQRSASANPEAIIAARTELALAADRADRFHDAYDVAAATFQVAGDWLGADHRETEAAAWNLAVYANGAGHYDVSRPLLLDLIDKTDADRPERALKFREELFYAQAGLGHFHEALHTAHELLIDCRELTPDADRTGWLSEILTDLPSAWSQRPRLDERRLWILGVGAPLAEVERFASHTSLYPSSRPSGPAGQEALIDGWGVTTQDELLEQLRWLLDEGHRDGYALELDHAVVAWDTCRYVQLVRMGVATGLLEEPDAWPLLDEIVALTRDAYGSWQEFGEDFLLGRAYWLGVVDAEYEDWPVGQRRTVEGIARLLDSGNDGSPWNRVPWNAV